VALAIVVASGSAALGHHSFAAHYFEEQSVTIEGTLAEFEYQAPHAWVHLDVTSRGSDVQRYSAEWANPNRLSRDGITKETLRPGDRVVITGSPGRIASENRIHLKRIERPADGWRWAPARR
jgi:hypothetical protein